ncbi:MAG: efflux RND transporter periplasmic adaptor subunit [Ideonella sp.]
MPPENATPAPSRRGLLLVAMLLLIAAVAVVVSGLVSRHTLASQLRERADAQTVRTVSVISPEAAGAAARLELPGRIEAYARAPIYARVSGYLKRWTVDIGGVVKAGQLLAEIETPDLDQQLLQAQAELATARSSVALATTTARRWQALLATDSVSRQEADEKAGDLVTKRSVVNALQANVDRVQALKRFTRITAPFDGVVTARSTDVGALITAGGSPGSELFVVSDLKKIRIYVNLPQAYVSAIKRGSKASLTVPGQTTQRHEATVQSLSQAISAGSGSMLIQLSADNPDADLLPGGFATVRFELPATKGTLSVPPGALMFNKAGMRVAVVGADGKVQLKPVTVARDLGSVVELASGVAPDDRVIDSPPDGIENGDVVRVAAPPPARP